jgi:TPR repeat protein
MMFCTSILAGDAGVGFFVTRDGYFVTNYHTVINTGSSSVAIRDKFGNQFAAVVVATDTANDLVLLKAKGRFTAIPIAKSSAIEIGDKVFTAAANYHVSRGSGTGLVKAVVSSLTGLQGAPNIFAISMPPASNGIGGTGGPLLTSDGNVIGVMTAPRRSKLVLATNKGRTEGTAFAVKSDYLLALLATKKAAWSQLQPLNAATSRTHGQVARDTGRAVGVIVSGVEQSSDNNSPIPLVKSEVHAATSVPVPSSNPHYPAVAASVEEMFQTGHKALQQQDYPVAYHWLSQAAEQGHAKAQADLAGMYLNGQGVDKDALTASHWFRKAALQGDLQAGENLGILFREGLGVERDDIEAAWWFNRSAKQGSASAQANLGLMYEDGRGVSQDDAEAVQWFRRAAEQGNSLAQYRLGIHYVEGRGVVKDEAEATKWLTQSARHGFAQAQDYLRASRASPALTP